MSTITTESLPETGMPGQSGRDIGRDRAGALAGQWAAIHDAAAVVAALAGQVTDPAEAAVGAFPAALIQSGGQRLAVARQAMDDLSLMLEAGVRALLSLHARGANPAPAAAALWTEFRAARDAVLALAPPERRMLG